MCSLCVIYHSEENVRLCMDWGIPFYGGPDGGAVVHYAHSS